MTAIKDKLLKTIMALQSDQILQQMRNDQTLYNFKMQHIRELIHDELRLEEQLAAISEQNQQLKLKIKKSQDLNQSLRQQYASELQHIQIKCKQFISEKQMEKKQYELKCRSQVDELKDQIRKNKRQIELGREEILKLKRENQILKEDRRQLQNLKVQSEDQIIRIKRQYQEKNRQTQKRLKDFYEHKHTRQIGEYEQIIVKMQKDMHLIKECWERKCFEIQNQAKQESHLLAIQIEQKFRRQLKQHAQNLKLGKSVIISDSEEVLARRIQVIQHGFRQKLQQSDKKIQQMEEIIKIVRQQYSQSQQRNQQLNRQKRNQELNCQRLNQQLQDKKMFTSREIQKLKKQIQNKTSTINDLQKSCLQMQQQINQKREDIVSFNKKCSTLQAENLKCQQQITSLSNKIIYSNSIHQQQLSQIINYKQTIIQKQQIINSLNIQFQALKERLQILDKSLNEQKNKNSILNQNSRILRQKQKKLLNKIDKAHLAIRRLKKEQQILKQQVKCAFQMLRNRLSIEMTNLGDQANQIRQIFDRKYRQKMSEMLDQMQGKQSQLIDTVKEQKQAMRLQVKQYQKLLNKSEQQISRLKIMLEDAVKDNKNLLQQLQKQKLMSIRFQQKLQINQQIYMNNLSRVQKDVARSLSSFHSRWTQQIGRAQEDIQNKQIRIKILTESIENLNAHMQETKKQQTWVQDQVKKYKKKYQNLKVQRDQKIQSLLKKLDQQSKHRLNLERQLKQMRIAIMKGNYQTNNTNFSFNDKEKEYTNNKPSYLPNSKRQKSREQELELTELRDMVAKASQMFGQPAEKDSNRNINKRALF